MASRLINSSAIKQFALDEAQNQGRPRFTRVSGDLYPFIDALIRVKIKAIVHGIPSMGKTISARGFDFMLDKNGNPGYSDREELRRKEAPRVTTVNRRDAVSVY